MESAVLEVSWNEYTLIYVFPPLKPLPHLLHRIKMEGILVILIALDWPSWMWHSPT